jgi:ribosomal-protein-alanine N-acetyltransferase
LPIHAPLLFGALSDIRLYEFIAEEPPSTEAALEARYERLALRQSAEGSEVWLNWALRTQLAAQYVGYVQATIRTDETAEIAYVVSFAEWGKRYAREAVTTILPHLHEQYGAKLAVARVDTRNTRSIRLLEALGFQQASVRREAEWIHGVLTDEAEYKLRLTDE